jgi:hypothetical protein
MDIDGLPNEITSRPAFRSCRVDDAAMRAPIVATAKFPMVNPARIAQTTGGTPMPFGNLARLHCGAYHSPIASSGNPRRPAQSSLAREAMARSPLTRRWTAEETERLTELLASEQHR